MFKDVIRDAIVASEDITDDLSTYPFTTGQPEGAAVFTSAQIPEDAEFPCIHISGPHSTGQFGTREQQGGEAEFDVDIISDKSWAAETLETLSRATWSFLDRHDFTAALAALGYDFYGATATPPTAAPTSFPTTTIRVRIRFLKQ